MKLETGICGEQSVRVSAENTAKTMGSGTLDVFATPHWWHWPKRPAGRALPLHWKQAAARWAPSWSWSTPHPPLWA